MCYELKVTSSLVSYGKGGKLKKNRLIFPYLILRFKIHVGSRTAACNCFLRAALANPFITVIALVGGC